MSETPERGGDGAQRKGRKTKATLRDSFVKAQQQQLGPAPAPRMDEAFVQRLLEQRLPLMPVLHRTAETPTELPIEPPLRLRLAFEQPPIGGPALAPAGAPVAIYVAHGMGQQVPFETLDGVVAALRAAHVRRGVPAPAAIVRQIQSGDARLARAELDVGPAGRQVPVHLFEGYWAPHAEGRITLRETFDFLLRAGWAGARRSAAGSWWRMMFGRPHEFALSKRTLLAFLLTIIVLGVIGGMNAIVVAVSASRMLTASTAGWPRGALLIDLTVDFALCLGLVLGLLAAGVWIVGTLRRVGVDGTVSRPPRGLVHAGWLCVWAAVGTIVATGALIGYHLSRHAGSDAGAMWSGTPADLLLGRLAESPAPWWQVAIVIAVWAAVAAVTWLGRGFLLQYVGDVAIYVSSYRVNRFAEAREAIQTAALAPLRHIFTARDPMTGAFAYPHVIVVGHSLGSVIAYDALNAMIRLDQAAGGALSVVARTPLLLTSGSPLDKTAFIFRNQARSTADVREALAESMQPMLSSYALRPGRWVNLWSPNDWISGSLEYYDDGAQPPGHAQDVENEEDVEASTPLAAHNEYWSGTRFGDLLYDEVLARAAAPAPPRPIQPPPPPPGVVTTPPPPPGAGP